MSVGDNDLHDGLLELLGKLDDRITPDDKGQVRELVDANEFGIALEWLVDAIVETGSSLSPTELALVNTLATRMGVHPEILKKLGMQGGD